MDAKSKGYVAALVIIGAVLAACAALDPGDIFHAKTPIGIQKTEGLPSTLPVNDAESEYMAWREDVTRQDAEWRENIDGANFVVGLFRQATLGFLEDYGPMVGGIPVVGPVVMGLLPLATAWVSGRSNRRKGQEEGKAQALETASEKDRTIASLERQLERATTQLASKGG